MPTFTFDVTEEAIAYSQSIMESMPGNPGQESLVSSLDIDASAVITVYIAGPVVDVDKEYEIKISSSHPEAIGQIIDKGEQAFEEYAERAADIMNLIDQAFRQL